jgi:hypothetical protein
MKGMLAIRRTYSCTKEGLWKRGREGRRKKLMTKPILNPNVKSGVRRFKTNHDAPLIITEIKLAAKNA